MSNSLQELFPVTAESFDAPSVDGRKLHEWLNVKSKYADWARRCIDVLRLLQDDDFTAILNSEFSPPRRDHAFSVDAAKMIGMVTKTDKGNDIRRYFLDCEKQLLAKPEMAALPLLPAEVAESTFAAMLSIAKIAGVPESYAIFEAGEIAGQQSGLNLTPMLLHSPAMNDVPDSDVMLEPTELGQLFDLTAAEMNNKLAAFGLQKKVGGKWAATDSGKELCAIHQWKSPLSSKSGYNLKWKAAEIEALIDSAHTG